MDISQSPISNFQTNQSQAKRSGTEANATTEALKLKDTSVSSQNLKSLELKDGQLVKGQVVDLRYNEVKILLEPGKQVVTAILSDNVPLSIGQEAQFQVTEESPGHLFLKYLPDVATQSDVTIQKALIASNLPVTENNRALVTELLNHRMPIDKQTLQAMVKFSLANRDATPLTLVLMYKNKIPMTQANIKQFEAYQNGTHQLLNNIRDISSKLSELLTQSDTTNTSYKAAIQTNEEIIDILYHTTDNSSVNKQFLPISNLLSQEELTILSKAIEQKMADTPSLPVGVPPDIAKQISDGTISLNEAVKVIRSLFSEAPEQMPNQITQEAVNQAPAGPSLTSVISNLLKQYCYLPDISSKLLDVLGPVNHKNFTNYILGPTDRENLLNILSDTSDYQNSKENIAQGTASLKETLTYLQENITNADPETVRKILQAPEYSKLLEAAFLQKWTITPEMVSEKASVTDLYQQLTEDLDKINNLAKAGKSTEEILRFQEPLKDMQENLQFLKDLNAAFTYLQLPVQFKDKTTHTDLYVLTRKKSLNETSENLSVLLHLDMVNLGSLNVHIQMNRRQQIQTIFYMEDTEAGHLISDNLSSFISSLQEKGYRIQAEVKSTYKKLDFSKDFIEQNSHDNYVQRYSFDIRT